MPDPSSPTDAFAELMSAPQQFFAQLLPEMAGDAAAAGDMAHWSGVAQRLQAMWLEFQQEQAVKAAASPATALTDPMRMFDALKRWTDALPLANPAVQQRLWDDSVALWQGVLGQYGLGPAADTKDDGKPVLPRSDRRFADPKWREQPFFAVVHQTYLMLTEQILAMVDTVPGIEPDKQDQLRFATKTLVDALSPANFPLTNPLVMQRAIETRGDSLVKGMAHLIADLRRGQLTHTDPDAFRLGENIAVTPGKVIHETPLYQLIQYTPTTDQVLAVPLVIFPPWINRFYILDLNPQKSFIRWAVEQGVSVFVVSWKSADASMAEVVWDDYIRAQIDAIDTVRERLDVPAVHTIGYCVAGTTLAATLAILARRGEADKVKSVTFFTAQVDFEAAGELKVFIDDQQIAAAGRLGAEQGYLDGRVMAATFNMLRGTDLIWNYVVSNYLLGDDYPAFDLLHWNGDTTNLPVKWHQAYLKDLYRDNKLVIPDAMKADGTPIDLTRIETPAYIQAGREDHIAPAASVWRITRHLRGPWTFVLAGSGHIAGVVNPPASGKYQYWTNPGPVDSLADFVAGAEETKGSWWPHWIGWLRGQNPAEVPAKGKRVPGKKGEKVLEDAPGSYVKTR